MGGGIKGKNLTLLEQEDLIRELVDVDGVPMSRLLIINTEDFYNAVSYATEHELSEYSVENVRIIPVNYYEWLSISDIIIHMDGNYSTTLEDLKKKMPILFGGTIMNLQDVANLFTLSLGIRCSPFNGDGLNWNNYRKFLNRYYKAKFETDFELDFTNNVAITVYPFQEIETVSNSNYIKFTEKGNILTVFAGE